MACDARSCPLRGHRLSLDSPPADDIRSLLPPEDNTEDDEADDEDDEDEEDEEDEEDDEDEEDEDDKDDKDEADEPAIGS